MRGQPGALICGGETSMGPKRRLFSAYDPQETRDFVRQELHKILTEQEQRWNFDFSQGRPLEGRFQWEALPNEPNDDVSVIGGAVAQPLAGLSAEESAHSAAADGASDNSQEPSPPCADRQTIIPEFFAQKKRVASGPAEKQCDEGDSDESGSTSSSEADCLPPKRARPLP